MPESVLFFMGLFSQPLSKKKKEFENQSSVMTKEPSLCHLYHSGMNSRISLSAAVSSLTVTADLMASVMFPYISISRL